MGWNKKQESNERWQWLTGLTAVMIAAAVVGMFERGSLTGLAGGGGGGGGCGGAGEPSEGVVTTSVTELHSTTFLPTTRSDRNLEALVSGSPDGMVAAVSFVDPNPDGDDSASQIRVIESTVESPSQWFDLITIDSQQIVVGFVNWQQHWVVFENGSRSISLVQSTGAIIRVYRPETVAEPATFEVEHIASDVERGNYERWQTLLEIETERKRSIQGIPVNPASVGTLVSGQKASLRTNSDGEFSLTGYYLSADNNAVVIALPRAAVVFRNTCAPNTVFQAETDSNSGMFSCRPCEDGSPCSRQDELSVVAGHGPMLAIIRGFLDAR